MHYKPEYYQIIKCLEEGNNHYRVLSSWDDSINNYRISSGIIKATYVKPYWTFTTQREAHVVAHEDTYVLHESMLPAIDRLVRSLGEKNIQFLEPNEWNTDNWDWLLK